MESAAILVVGDEILSGEVVDENTPFLLKALKEACVRVVRTVTVPDLTDPIVEELQHLRALADAVVMSGGLGPTHDDLTRPAVAEALGTDLVRHEEAERRIRAWYKGRVTDAELSMAFMPRGAELVDGEKTGTFGFAIAGVYALPGVPFLFRDIAKLLPARFAAVPLHRRVLHTNRREGEIAPRLAEVQGRCVDVAIGSYPVYEHGGWSVRVVLRAPDAARLKQVTAEVEGYL